MPAGLRALRERARSLPAALRALRERALGLPAALLALRERAVRLPVLVRAHRTVAAGVLAGALVIVALALVAAQSGGTPEVAAPSPTATPTPAPTVTGVLLPPPAAPATPTPTPDPAVWRYEGMVVDEAGTPLPGVCIWIGPNGCRPFSPHTDGRGVYFFDAPQNPSIEYELTFELAGYVSQKHRVQPAGPTIFNVVLQRAG